MQTDFDFQTYDFDEVVLMQYIGDEDKNGVEVWEGDILSYDMSTFPRPEKSPVVVEWSGSGFFIDGCYICEVIGNIHQNPELLENKHGMDGVK